MPQVSSREVVAFLNRQGFMEYRQAGSHLTMVHPDGRQTTVPVHRGDLGRGLAVDILKGAGYSVDDFIALR